ncbi:MAG: Na+/H+ antiporter NhaA [Rhodothermales bacterium]
MNDNSNNTAFNLFSGFQRFFKTTTAGGILLLFFAVVAMVWANSPWAAEYQNLWGTYVTTGFGGWEISKPLLLWVNDGLMAIFFFLVGLEIKREMLVGELSDVKQAIFPMAAALGGMIVPALIYVFINRGTEFVAGWGVPMATDIAFALGILALLGSRVPVSLKIFLTAVAIVDDLGAVLVIALFYTSELAVGALFVAAVTLAILTTLNKMGVQRTAVYVFFGLILWVAVLKSGVHATVAGVLLAMTIPAKRRLDEKTFETRLKNLADRFRDAEGHPVYDNWVSGEQQDIIHEVEVSAKHAETPLVRMEHALHGWVAFFIMPLFALANAGVSFRGIDVGEAILHPVSLGILVGLFVGKQVGIFAFAWAAVKTGLTSLPEGVTWRAVYGVACLAGIGFTMALFIAGLAFEDAEMLNRAKMGILSGSLLAGLLGWGLLRMGPSAEKG